MIYQTVNPLSVQNRSVGPQTPLSDKEILGALNAIADQILEDEISPVAVCRKGCGTCCRFPVHIIATEAKIIAAFTNRKINKLANTKLIGNKEIQDDYCPFFDKKMSICTIYDVRPLACKLYSSLDHYDYCGGKEIHAQTTLQHTKPVNYGYLFLSNRLQQRELKGKGATAADIRYWFR